MRDSITYISDVPECVILTYATFKRAKYFDYSGVTNAHVMAALCRAIGHNLRYNRTQNVMLDSTGWLSRPASQSEWPEATQNDAIEYLCHEVWCSAVTSYNRHKH